MFTGIIEEIGKVKSISNNTKSSRIEISATKVLDNTLIGDSISTNGVCLTVTELDKNSFTVDVMAETVRSSNLSKLKVNDQVNLERALTLQTRLGGHLVSGHVDIEGRISNVEKEENATWITIAIEQMYMKYMVKKGSVAIDGVSLTIQDISESNIRVSIIPHTKEVTTLLHKSLGDSVNIEIDMMVKYVERLLSFKQEKEMIDESFLRKHGYM